MKCQKLIIEIYTFFFFQGIFFSSTLPLLKKTTKKAKAR